MATTTVKVSKETVRELEALQRSLGTKSLEETIRLLMRERRKQVLDSLFGADKGRISSFSEEDRGEDRS